MVLPARETAVVVVDCQNDFCHPDGKLYSPASREIIPRLVRLVEKARAAGAKVFYTQDTHMPDDNWEFPIWGPHAIRGTWGWEIVDELKPREGDVVVQKPRYDAFYDSMLDHLLRMYGVRHLVIAGTVANICVLHTVAGAWMRTYRVVVPADAIAALNEFDYAATLRQLDFVYRVPITTVEGVEFA